MPGSSLPSLCLCLSLSVPLCLSAFLHLSLPLSVQGAAMKLGAWGGSTEEAVRARYEEYGRMRAQRPRPSSIAWIGGYPKHDIQVILQECGWTIHSGTDQIEDGRTYACCVVAGPAMNDAKRIDALRVVYFLPDDRLGVEEVTHQFRSDGPWSDERSLTAETAEEVLQYINEDVLIDQAKVIDRFTPRPALDLFEGCLVGVAVGDAVGLGVEGADMGTCVGYTDDLAADLGKMLKPWSIPKREGPNRERFTPGQISDDTQCTRELSRAIIASGGFSVKAFVATMGGLHAGKGVIGQGPTSRATLDALMKGLEQAKEERVVVPEGGMGSGDIPGVDYTVPATWMTAGAPGKMTSTNGSIMRVAPIGLLGWNEPTGQLLTANAVIQSHVTHHNPLCKAGSAAVAAAVAAALHARATGGSDLSAAVLAAMVEPYGSMLAAMLAAPDWKAAAQVMYDVQPPSAEFLETSPFQPPSITMFPPHTAGWAIYSAISEPSAGFWPAIFKAIAPGGDTDTVAACAGAIAGAWHGLRAIRSERSDSGKVLSLLHDADEPGSCDVRGLCHLAQGIFHVATRQRGDWVAEMKVGGNCHSMAPRPAGLVGVTPDKLSCKGDVVVVWQNASPDAILDGCAALESCGVTVYQSLVATSILGSVRSALSKGSTVCVVTDLQPKADGSGLPGAPGMIGNVTSPDWNIAAELRLLSVPVVVYDHGVMTNTLGRHHCGHHWIRHVAYSLNDAVIAACLLTGASPPSSLPPAVFGAPQRTSRVCTIGISGSSRGGKGVLSEGLRNTFGSKNCWVLACDSYFNLMAINTLGPSWWGGETNPDGDYAQTKSGNWDTPGAVDHCKLLADAKQLIAEAERLSAIDGEERLVVMEGFMLFYDPVLVSLFDRQVWLELTYEVRWPDRSKLFARSLGRQRTVVTLR